MKLEKKLLVAALVMLAVAVLFVFCVLFILGPEASLPISYEVTMAIYKGYLAVMVALFLAAFIVRLKRK